jgi:hypothetical protein
VAIAAQSCGSGAVAPCPYGGVCSSACCGLCCLPALPSSVKVLALAGAAVKMAQSALYEKCRPIEGVL